MTSKNILRLWLLVFSVTWAGSASAYVPNTRFILDKVTKHHGRGSYSIEQEILFQKLGKQVLIQEKWIVIDENNLFLLASGPGFQSQFLYRKGVKHLKVENVIKTQPIGNEFFEALFHVRKIRSLERALVSWNVIPKAALKRTPKMKDKEEALDYSIPPYINLSRIGGLITYAVGTPTPIESLKQNPGIWIEQDRFVIRKIRFPSESEIIAEDYGDYSKNLMFPKSRIIHWPGKSVQIRVLRVNSIGSKEARKNVSATKLTQSSSNKIESAELRELVTEFYSRFR